MIVEWLALAVAVVALLVSARAAHSASQSASRAQNQSERILALEVARDDERRAAQRKARVVAFFSGAGALAKVFLRNEGNAPARRVEAFLDGVNLRESRSRVGAMSEVVDLGPSAEIGFHFTRTIGTKGHFKVRVTWADDSGEPGEWESDLSF